MKGIGYYRKHYLKKENTWGTENMHSDLKKKKILWQNTKPEWTCIVDKIVAFKRI